jgi:hypothetical protein
MKHFALYVVVALMTFTAGCGHGTHRFFGKLAYVAGTAQVFGKASGSWAPAQNGASVFAGDSVRTLKDAEAVVTFGNNTIKLSENTCITIGDTVDGQNKRLIAVLNAGGEVLSDVKDIKGSGTRYEVWTPTALARAEGTHFVVEFSPQPYVTHVRVLDGSVRVFNPFLPSAPPVLVSPGCYTTVAYNAAPVATAPMNYGQFKKLQPLVGPQYYHEYEVRFKVNPDEMTLDAPLVVVPIVSATVFVPLGPPMPFGPHGRLIVPGPFLLPPGPGMPLPGVSRGGVPAPPLPPGPPIHPMAKKGRVVAPGPIVPIPVPHPGVAKAAHGGGGNGKGRQKGDKR